MLALRKVFVYTFACCTPHPRSAANPKRKAVYATDGRNQIELALDHCGSPSAAFEESYAKLNFMLTEFQKRFVSEVIISPANVSDAVRRAGYKGKNAGVRGTQLMSNPEIADAVAAAQKKVCDKLEITAERVLQELAVLGFATMDDYTELDEDNGLRLNLSKTTRQQRAAIAEFTEDSTGGSGDGERKAVLRTKIKLWDKTRGLELLGKHLKLFTDVVKHEGLESLAGILTGQE